MEILEKYFDAAFEAPDGIKRLRELILTLAMQGKLVAQDLNDQPASEILKAIEKEKKQLIKEKKAKKSNLVKPLSKDNIPFNIPNNWTWSNMYNISIYIQRGKGPKYVDDSSYKVVSQKCVRWQGLDLQPARCIDPDSLDKYEKIRFLKENDLLWNSTGTGTIGRACLVSNDVKEQILVADSHVTVIRPYKINPKFLFYWVQSPYVYSEIENIASGSTNQIELNTSTVINHLIPLPPKNEQERIVKKINQLMALCNELEKLKEQKEEKKLTIHKSAINLLFDSKSESNSQKGWHFISNHFNALCTVKENVSELRSAILQLAMQGKLVLQDRNDQPVSELLEKIENEKKQLEIKGKIKKNKYLSSVKKDEIPFEIPEQWEWTKLGLITTFSFGKTPASKDTSYWSNNNNGVSWTSIKDMPTRGYLMHTQKSITQKAIKDIFKNQEPVEVGTLLMSFKLSIGKTAITTMPTYHNEAIISFKYLNNSLKMYLYWILGDLSNQGKYKSAIKGKTLNSTSLNNLLIPLPPLNEQKRIVKKIDQLMALCDDLEKQIENSSSKQTELLNAIMSNLGK
ncbi:restriction endonuclease subunit S [Halarcobacter sp.]|uniref:restriction endonuclease subunit S n=1 Tax=Halarcobacter sp. TaxID=2321133 RepID=UPI003A94DCBD